MINEIEKGLMYLIKKEYYKLRMIHPGHELLKYGFLDKSEVRIPHNLKIAKDFIEHFFPDSEDFFKRKWKSYEGCERILFLITFKNYYIALKEAIKKARERISLN